MKQRATMIAVLAGISGCNPAPEVPAFSVRGLEIQSEGLTAGVSYKAEATLLQTHPIAPGRYMVILQAWRTSGGAPDMWNGKDTIEVPVVVSKGSGDIDLYLGYRTSNDRWDPPRIAMRVVGYIPITPVTYPDGSSGNNR